MKRCIFLSVALAVAGLAGCANPGQIYANKHPELTPAQRSIMSRGVIPTGDEVAGLTRAQIKLAMGGDPTTFDKIDGEDVWIYTHKKMVGNAAFDDSQRQSGTSMEDNHSFSPTEALGPRSDVEMKTTGTSRLAG
jgi:outer membrane protein assembly factor BamE (lipoprotein component of BamABCDE complex)